MNTFSYASNQCFNRKAQTIYYSVVNQAFGHEDS